MAERWMIWREGLESKDEVKKMAAQLGVSCGDVCVAMMRFWSWVSTNYEPPPEDRNCRVTLDALRMRYAVAVATGDERYFDALLSSGWLLSGDEGYQIPNWDRHNSKTAKKLALAQKRQARFRSKRNATSVTKRNADSVTGCQSPPVATKPKLPQKVDEHELPPELDVPDFRVVWQLWVKHRREIKHPLTPTSTRQQLKELASWGVKRATAAINHTIARGWRGIQEPPSGRNGHPLFEQAPSRPCLSDRPFGD